MTHSLLRALLALALALPASAAQKAVTGVQLTQIPTLAAQAPGLPSAGKLPEGTSLPGASLPVGLPKIAGQDGSPQAKGPQAAAQGPQGASQAPHASAQSKPVFTGVKAPPTRRDETVVDDYHGTAVKDAYRWLEDDRSEETKAWVDAQNEVTEKALAQIPERAELAARVKELWNYERVGTPTKIGKYWIFSANDGLQNQSVMYKARHLKGKREVLLDPNALSQDGTSALAGTSFSRDGKYMAYAISKAGSDWSIWKIKNVETGFDLPDTIRWTKFTGASWSKDGKGFYYTRYPEPQEGDELKGANENSKVYYHKVGQAQSEDRLVYEDTAHPRWSFGGGEMQDSKRLILYQHEGTEPKNRVLIKDLTKPDAPFKALFGAFDADYSVIGSDGDTFYVQTTKDAPRGRLIAVNVNAPDPKNWRTIIPESKDRSVLGSVQQVGKKFVAVWTTDAHEVMRVYGPRGGFKYEVALPGIGSVDGFSPTRRGEKKKGFFSYNSFNQPSTHYRLNLETGKVRAYWKPKLPIDSSKFEVKQVFYPSKDGTKIPMFLIHKKGLVLDGTNPTYLYGYGGFNVSLTPSFSGARMAWLERGGVYAMANLRGGGEYGQEWHDAGRLHNKQNVFDDFIAAAEWLIANKYTSTPRLAIGGGSNGGLLVGAAMTQRPDLFGAAIPEVGVLDMLRFHLFTVGRGWKSDYGTSETPEGFATLYKYSPLHNVREGARYPATMVMTGDHDDRVVPAHSHKFTAALQNVQAEGAPPILTRIEKDAGHGAGKPMSKLIQEVADRWAFLLKALGVSRGNGA